MDEKAEASDPLTPADRLRALADGRWTGGFVLLNPSCPPDLLTQHLSRTRSVGEWPIAIWQNPAIPMLALVNPSWWEETALSHLVFLTRYDVPSRQRPRWKGKGLAHAVQWWCVREPSGDGGARRFAEVLARVFGLPWQEPKRLTPLPTPAESAHGSSLRRLPLPTRGVPAPRPPCPLPSAR